VIFETGRRRTPRTTIKSCGYGSRVCAHRRCRAAELARDDSGGRVMQFHFHVALAHALAFSRRISRPSYPNSSPSQDRGRREDRALAAPMVACKKARGSHHRFSRDNPAFPAQWLYGLLRALPGDRLSCPRRPRARRTASLASAPGCQDHTTSPCVSMLFVGANDHAATRYAHRIPLPTSVTIAIRPSVAEAGRAEISF
jgi:hypothetical protein